MAYVFLIIGNYIFSYFTGTILIVRYSYILELLLNLLLVLIVGFGGWYFKFWTEGDAKLFLAYTAIIPLSVYSFNYIKYAPSYMIILNTLVPLFLYYVLSILFKSLHSLFGKGLSEIRSYFTFKSMLLNILLLFSISWIPVLLKVVFEVKLNAIIQYAVVILFSIIVQKTFKGNLLKFFAIISVLRLILDKSIYSFDYVISFFIMVFILVMIDLIINHLGRDVLYRSATATQLKPGMTIVDIKFNFGSDKSKEEQNKAIQSLVAFIFKHKKVKLEDNIDLGNNDIKAIQKYISDKRLSDISFSVKETMPFAPYLFAGVLLTLYLRGSIFHIFSEPISYFYDNQLYIAQLTLGIMICAIITFVFMYKSKYITISETT